MSGVLDGTITFRLPDGEIVDRALEAFVSEPGGAGWVLTGSPLGRVDPGTARNRHLCRGDREDPSVRLVRRPFHWRPRILTIDDLYAGELDLR